MQQTTVIFINLTNRFRCRIKKKSQSTSYCTITHTHTSPFELHVGNADNAHRQLCKVPAYRSRSRGKVHIRTQESSIPIT
jgi:hypothetical protein